jgi:hypothetical protein
MDREEIVAAIVVAKKYSETMISFYGICMCQLERSRNINFPTKL